MYFFSLAYLLLSKLIVFVSELVSPHSEIKNLLLHYKPVITIELGQIPDWFVLRDGRIKVNYSLDEYTFAVVPACDKGEPLLFL